MTPLHRTLAIAGHVVFLATLAGLIVRRRWRLGGFFAAYVAFGAVVNPLVVWWPASFFRQWFYLLMQVGFDVLKFGIALELGWRTFRPFPTPRVVVLLASSVILGATAIWAAAVPISASAWEWEIVVGEFFPRVKIGSLWLMAAPLVLATWYHVPIHPFQSAVVTSFASYLGFSSALLWLSTRGGAVFVLNPEMVNAVDVTADLILACYWAYTAWRPESATARAHVETLGKLQLRAAS
jgi:hypothetical protein